MVLGTPGERLQWARRQHGKFSTAREAVMELGWVESTYFCHENGQRIPRRQTAKKYARAYGVRWEWLLEGEGEPKAAIRAAIITYVPVVSWTSAGKLADPQSTIPAEDVPLLALTDLGAGDFIALRVVGNSMDRVSPDGSVIVLNRADRQLIPGRYYVFMYRGETTYKRWHADPPAMEPYSTNPEHRPRYVKKMRGLEVIGRVKRTMLDL
jgi:SOS-response transcriptional repressor LexA